MTLGLGEVILLIEDAVIATSNMTRTFEAPHRAVFNSHLNRVIKSMKTGEAVDLTSPAVILLL